MVVTQKEDKEPDEQRTCIPPRTVLGYSSVHWTAYGVGGNRIPDSEWTPGRAWIYLGDDGTLHSESTPKRDLSDVEIVNGNRG